MVNLVSTDRATRDRVTVEDITRGRKGGWETFWILSPSCFPIAYKCFALAKPTRVSETA